MASVASLALPDLFVNDGKLETTQVGSLQPVNPRTTSMGEMRKRLDEDGYLYLKGLLPREDVLEARKQYFQMLSPTGLLKPGTSPVEGIFNPDKEAADFPGFGTGRRGTGGDASEQFMDLALKAHGEPWYKDVFCKHPVLMNFVAKLTGWEEKTGTLDRTLLRNNLPGNSAIGVHYDYIFLRHGKDSVLTAWVPMGDITLDGGGLIYLDKGHELGQAIEKSFTERAKATGMTDEQARFAFNQNMMSGGVLTQGAKAFSAEHQRSWLVSAYEAGDVVLHNAYMVHASTVNHDTKNSIRLATDLRYVDTSKPWDQRWAKVYEDGDGL
ncbi:hypothetical protein ACHAPJ_009655 [Fusarium lateritium]